MKRFLVFAPSFDERMGGTVALHRLCHLINALGRDCRMFPNFSPFHLDPPYSGQPVADLATTRAHVGGYQVCRRFDTPVLEAERLAANYGAADVIVIYPEVTSGNPLRARHVVRWFLHDPGFHTGTISYGPNEIYFRYGPLTKPVQIAGSTTSRRLLTVLDVPFEHYNLEGASSERQGTAYYMGKGKGRSIVHDVSDSVLIDGRSHAEVSMIFRKVRQFISYDTRTLYSPLAILCGCQSVVVPDQGVSEAEWCPDENLRLGISYGLGEKKIDADTVQAVARLLREYESNSARSVQAFVEEVDEFFA